MELSRLCVKRILNLVFYNSSFNFLALLQISGGPDGGNGGNGGHVIFKGFRFFYSKFYIQI